MSYGGSDGVFCVCLVCVVGRIKTEVSGPAYLRHSENSTGSLGLPRQPYTRRKLSSHSDHSDHR